MNSTHSIGVIADTEFGAVRGTIDGSTNVWKGIRYAAPPVGALRFRAPQPPKRSEAVVDATEFGARSVQPRSSGRPRSAAHSDENCLTVDVWSPPGGASRKPVLFWIHGEDTLAGSAHERAFSGRSLAESGDVIVVSVSYRRGILGFVDFSSLATRQNPADSNLALRDVMAALEWVQGNIAQFGGDPTRVTISGESSGGGIVTTLLATPAAAGLFHRAIAQSPAADAVHTAEHAAHIAHTVLALLRVHPAHLDLLRETSTPALIAAGSRLAAVTGASEAAGFFAGAQVSESARPADTARSTGAAPGSVTGSVTGSAFDDARTLFAPVVDGTLVREHPLTAFQNGRAHRVPLVIGSNRDETTGVAAAVTTWTGGHTTAATRAHDAAKRLPTLAIAEAHSQFAPVWLYRFDHSTPLRKALGSRAPRSAELPYLWGALPRGPVALLESLATGSAAQRLSSRLQHRWSSFARLGVPTHAVGEPVWTSYDEHRATLVFDDQDRLINDLDSALRLAHTAGRAGESPATLI